MAIRKTFKKVRKYSKKRYFGKKKASLSSFKFNKLKRDVFRLKSIINSEKKNIVVQPTANTIGQVNGNAEGALVIDITPRPPQGTSDNERIGDSIKLTTAYLKFQISQMTATISPIRGSIEIYKVLGTPQATSTFLDQKYKPNVFITGANIRDLNAQMDQDFAPQYKLVAKRSFRLKGDTVSNQTQLIDVSIPIKFGNYGHHIKYNDNTTTIASGQIMMIVRTDAGNISPSTASTLGNLVIYGANSGAYLNKSMTFYYYDN